MLKWAVTVNGVALRDQAATKSEAIADGGMMGTLLRHPYEVRSAEEARFEYSRVSLLNDNTPARELVRMYHPRRQGRTIPMPAAGACRSPCRYRTKQQCRGKRECQDDRAATGAGQGGLCVGDAAVDTTFGIDRG